MQRILSPFPHTGKEAARVCSLQPQEISGPTGDSPPREHTSTALLWITAQASRGSPGMLFRATSSGFSAISSGLPQSCTQQSGSFFPSHLVGGQRDFCQTFFLYHPRETHATCLYLGLPSCLQSGGPKQYFQLQPHSPVAGERGSAQPCQAGLAGPPALPGW